MLEYDRIDISEGIDFKKTNALEECKICHYWYFKDINFKCKSHLCNGCHGLMQKAVSFNDFSIVYVNPIYTREGEGKITPTPPPPMMIFFN